MKGEIVFGSRTIKYEVVYSARKSLGITVTPSRTVVVKAPVDVPAERISERVRKRAPWIIKQQKFFLSFEPKTPERRYVSGETHLYLGRQYQLRIVEGDDNVKLRGRFLEVSTKDKAKVEQLVKHWYGSLAKLKFTQYAAPWIERFKRHGVKPSAIVLRQMPTRWGSCTPNGKIILNPELLKAPKGCIEYVIVHELCHLVHHDHTAKFIELQSKEMPGWEKWKHNLETLLA